MCIRCTYLHLKTKKWCWEALFRGYGCFFAEFLGNLSLVRLRLRDENTCFSLRYGCISNKFREFSRRVALHHRPGRTRTFPLFLEYWFPDFPGNLPQSTDVKSNNARHILTPVLPSLRNAVTEY